MKGRCSVGANGTVLPAATDVLRKLKRLVAERRRVGRLRVLLDYDGTLVPVAARPEFAVPDGELIALLAALARLDDLDVELVSGRPRESLDSWFGGLHLSMWAEHGFWHRSPGAARWARTRPEWPAWIVTFRPMLARFAEATPGSRIEIKDASIAWHYREASVEQGGLRARQLRALLREVTDEGSVEVLEGKKVIEIRPVGVSKAIVARRIAEEAVPPGQILAFGDDRTDDELFVALPRDSLTVAVGSEMQQGRYRLADHREVRSLLQHLVAGERTIAAGMPRHGARVRGPDESRGRIPRG